MLAWMRPVREVQRRGVENSGSCGEGRLRHLQAALLNVPDVTGPDMLARRRRGRTHPFDAESTAHAAWAERRRVTRRRQEDLVESLRVPQVCRQTAMPARRNVLQIIETSIVCAQDKSRAELWNMTRMQLSSTLAALQPDMTGDRRIEETCRISLRFQTRRYLDL